MDQGPQVTMILIFNTDYLPQKFMLCGGREAKVVKMPLQMSWKGALGTDASLPAPAGQEGALGAGKVIKHRN